VVYFGASAAIVVLERLAHTDPDLLPTDLRLGYFEFSEAVSEVKVEELPGDWLRDENATRRRGEDWRLANSSCLLMVPSAILPEESNFVFNPLHHQAKHLHLIRERAFQFDPRLI
jgi:RES domain-containing protein